MEYINMWDEKSFVYKINDLNIDSDVVTEITMDYRIMTYNSIYIFSNNEHPIVHIKNFLNSNILSVDRECYFKNRLKYNEIIKQICTNSKQNKIEIFDINLITDDVIEAIANNPNIKKITLGSKEQPFLLNKKYYEILKKGNKESIITHGVTKELDNVFDEIIDYNMKKHLLSCYNYKDLNEQYIIDLSGINENQLDNLRLISEDKKINFQSKSINFELMIDVINLINRNNSSKNGITIEFSNNLEKKDLYQFLSSSKNKLENNSNVFIESFMSDKISVSEFINKEKILYSLVEPAVNLTPYEKFLFAYNKVKQFKEYQENEENRMEARDLYKIMDNEFIVCSGFTELLQDLLFKLGIDSKKYSVVIDVGLDNINSNDFRPLPESVETIKGYHSRLLVNIIDEKYGINGYYISDPTWDNYLDEDFYNHSLMTPDEEVGLKRYNRFDLETSNELLYCNGIEEFYQKTNKLIKKFDKKVTKKELMEFLRHDIVFDIFKIDPIFKKIFEEKFGSFALYDTDIEDVKLNQIMDFIGDYIIKNQDKFKNKLDTSDIEKRNIFLSHSLNTFFLRIQYYINKNHDKSKTFRNLFDSINDLIIQLDNNLCKEIEERFGNLNEYNREYTNNEIEEIITFIGNKIIAKSNNQISGEKYKEAITVLYRDIYKYPDYEQRVEKTMTINKEIQEIVYPKIIKESQDGTREVIYNEENKFDLESESNSKYR